MLLPDSSDNMTAIIDDLARLGGILGKADNTIFNQIGHWFNGVFGNVMGKVMMSRSAMIVPLLVGLLCFAFDLCIIKCLARKTVEHLGIMGHMYSALRKYSAPLNFATFCHISGFKHKDIKLYFFVKNQQQVGHNHEVERHLLDISNFFNKSKTEKLGVQNYSAPLS